MTDRELLQEAQDALNNFDKGNHGMRWQVPLIKALRARLAQSEQESVAVWELQEGGWDTIADPNWMETLPIGTKLYTAPPQRKEWVGLTREELEEISEFHFHGALSGREFYDDVEAKLKEKNI